MALGILWLAALGLPAAQAQVQVGVAVHSGGDSFHLAIGDYYHAPPEQIEVVEQRHIPDEESPVVFFIAAQAHVAPGVIVDLRSGGMGWGAIAERYRLGPEVFYVPAEGGFKGTPYERFYRECRREGFRMRDREIVNMVNLRFACDYYHRPAEEIIHMRSGGRNFRAIHEHYHPYPKEKKHKDRHHGHGHHGGWDDRDHRDGRHHDRDDDHDRHDDRWDRP